MDLDDVDRLWERHPAWRLLRARNAPMVLSFLGRYFIEENQGATSMSELVRALDDHLYAIHQAEPDRYPADPIVYLDDWSASESGWLRRFYPTGSDDVHYDVTPALEKAYRWVESLQARSFVGTESRLHILIELLRQMVHGTETDPAAQIAELKRRRAVIDEELQRVEGGQMTVLDETALRDRYQQFASTARQLLSDFREVEENFRVLDRSAREKIAAWDRGKGDLLAELIGSRTDIAASDQGRSFQAFYDFLLSEQRQDELSSLLTTVQAMPRIESDHRLRTVHHDWADAAERTQQTVRNLSDQLRRFLEDQVWVENRRVLELVRVVELAAIAVRDTPPGAADGVGLTVDEPGIQISLPFERPLYDPQPEIEVDSLISPQAHEPVELDALFAQRFVDEARLVENIRAIVPRRSTASLDDIVALYPVEEGIAEILGYLSLGDHDDVVVNIVEGEMLIDYSDSHGVSRRVTMPHVTVTRR
jgi:flagellar motility protein MotE (MotC chaperone)